MAKNTSDFNEGRESLLIFIWQKRKIIIPVTFVTAIVATITSFLLTPTFKSTAIIFPAATSNVSFSEQRNAKNSSVDFGEDEQAEQLVQILQSSRVRNIIVNRYKLIDHYGIDSNDVNKNYKLGKAWDNHINFTRTRYGSIQIDVLDEDRFLAAEIANKIVDIIDTVKNQMIQERTLPAFKINQRKRNQLEIEKRRILKRLDSLSNLGVVSIEGRANLFSAYNNSKNNLDRAFFKKQIDVNLQYGATFDGLEIIRDEKITQLTKFEEAYEQAESDAYTLFNHKFVVESAVVADKKAKPKRLTIITLTTIGAFVFIIFLLLINARISKLKNLA